MPRTLVSLGLCALIWLAACSPLPDPSAPIAPSELEWQHFQLANSLWTGEYERVAALLAACPGDETPLAPSPGNAIRDALRREPVLRTSRRETAEAVVQARDAVNAGVLSATTNVALADWYARRAAAARDSTLCDRGREALGTADQAMRQTRIAARAATIGGSS